MKKNTTSACLSSLVCLLLAACNLDYAPENTLVDEKVYKTERTAEAALLGAYVRLNVLLSGAPQDQNNYSNTGFWFLLADVGTDNLKARSSASSFIAIETGTYTSSEHDGLLYNIWQWGYNAIDMANNVIAGVSQYGGYGEQATRQHIAEAKFIRAYCYLALLSAFGDKALMGNDTGCGVVLRLEPYSGYNPDDIQGRATNADCWAQIIKDLEEALPYLSDDVPAIASRVRANKAVAEALLSRVYLYKGTYTNNTAELQKACDYAKAMLEAQGYTFTEACAEFSSALFPSNEYSQSSSYPDPTTRSNELLFFEPSRIYTDNYPNGMSYYRKQSYYIPQSALQQYDEEDVRRTYLIWQGSKSEYASDLTSAKYSGGMYDDVIYIRRAEAMLTYAETLVRTTGSVSAEAVNMLNQVHQRAYANGDTDYTIAVNTDMGTDAFLRECLLERNRELAYEGHHRWDIIRTGNLIGDTTMNLLDPARWNLPVPDYEIRISYGKITQNSGYAD